MSHKCFRCEWSVHELDLNESVQQRYYQFLQNGERMRAIQLLYQSLDIKLSTAKEILLHQTLEYGTCVRCGFEELQEERIFCPKCRAFNYNLDFRSTTKDTA